jgi:anti-anti-sigma regulatory factor
LGLDTAPGLADCVGQLIVNRSVQFLADLSGLDFWDSTGIGTFAATAADCVAAGLAQ